MNRLIKPLTVSLLALSLGACATMAPEYTRPDAPVRDQWATTQADVPVADAPSATQIPWSQMFADTRLQTLITQALQHNRDLRIATLNIERARAQYRIQRAELVPQVGVSGTQSAQRTPDDLAPGGVGGVTRSYGVSVGVVGYELDLFGRVRSLKDAALQQYLATEQAQRAAQISLVSEVATAYLAVGANQSMADLAQRTLATREDALRIAQQRAGIGTGSDLQLRQAEGEREGARDAKLAADRDLAMSRNALELLVGTPVQEDLLPEDGLHEVLAVERIPAGLPSNLLTARPDILAAEHRLRGANANIGAARAAFFPSISLTGSAGTASDALSGLFGGGGRTWSFMPQINLPIFSGGRLKAQLSMSEADRDIAVAEYEQAIQVAFRDVADALAVNAVADGQLDAQHKRRDAAQQAQALVQRRYDQQVAGYLEVLDAQRTLYAAEQALIGAQLAGQVGRVDLYKALGGGLAPQVAIGTPPARR